MIISEIEYQRALEKLRHYGEDLLHEEDAEEIARIERHQYALIRDVCAWILNRPRGSDHGVRDFFAFLDDIEERCDIKLPLRRNRGNTTNHPTGKRHVSGAAPMSIDRERYW